MTTDVSQGSKSTAILMITMMMMTTMMMIDDNYDDHDDDEDDDEDGVKGYPDKTKGVRTTITHSNVANMGDFDTFSIQ